MRLVLIAADPMEFPGILAHAPHSRAFPLSVNWARSARLATHDVLLVANGAGKTRAGAAVDAACAAFPPDAVVSTGFCGALDPRFAIADIVVGTAVQVPSGDTYPALPVSASRPFRSGLVSSINHVAQTAAEKAHLHAGGACAVEMEAAGVAQHAQVLGLPFYCVRVVTDLAGEDMSNDFNAALRSDGHFDTIHILRGSLRHPTVRLPELLRLRKRCVRAARVLGEFIADCRF